MSAKIKLTVCGKTYPLKEKLKAMGLRWNPDREWWEGWYSQSSEANILSNEIQTIATRRGYSIHCEIIE